MNPELAGMIHGMTKVAKKAIGEVVDIVYDSIRGLLASGVDFDDQTVLAILFEPEHDKDTRLESLIFNLEQRFSVSFDDKELAKIFDESTVKMLSDMASKKVMEKTADFARFQRHQNYYRQRHQIAVKKRTYRMSHLQQERRRSRRYRKQVKRGQRKKATRMGSAAAGFKFIGGYGSKVRHPTF